MRAMVFGPGATARVGQVPDPAPGPGEVLVRVEAAGICHTDLDILHGRYPAALPRIPGHEVAGTVVATGPVLPRPENPVPPVAPLVEGERVAIDPLLSCGRCVNCAKGHPNLCVTLRAYGADLDGGVAELVVVRATNAHRVGDLPAAFAALAEPTACMLHALGRAAPRPGDRALVLGAGPMGLLLTMGLREQGVDSVTVADLLDDRLEAARRFGATDTATAGDDLVGQLRDGDGRDGYDLVVDATGRPPVVAQGLSLLADSGTLLLFGVCPPGSSLTLDPNEVYRRQLRVLGSFSLCGSLPAALKVLAATAAPVDELASHSLPLERAVEALDLMGTAGTRKIQIAPPQRGEGHA